MKKQARIVPLGEPLNTSDPDMDMLALVTPEDIEDAKAAAVERMSKRGAALLAAERADQDDTQDDN